MSNNCAVAVLAFHRTTRVALQWDAGFIYWYPTPVDALPERVLAFLSSLYMNDIPLGTLDVMVLQSLHSMGRMHGYGIARRLEQVSQDALLLKQGTIYPALVRLQGKGWISSQWGLSENNRKAKFYTITPTGRKQLVVETAQWNVLAGTMARLMKVPE